MISQAVVRTALWLALGGWVGSWGFFAFVVSRIAFQVLPGDVAGDLAGALLSILHVTGAAAAAIVVGASIALGRRGAVVGLPIVLALVCLASEIWLSPEVAAVRPSALGAESTMEAAQRFKRLHALSLGLFMAVHLASIVLLAWHARLDALVSTSSSEESHR
jgi:hypothetical protein